MARSFANSLRQRVTPRPDGRHIVEYFSRRQGTTRDNGGLSMDGRLVWAHSSRMRGWDNDILGYLASVMVLSTFCMRSMRPLRISAILSDMAFISYAYVTDMRPILIMYCILLPVIIVRLAQIEFDGIGRAEPDSLRWSARIGGWRRRRAIGGFARGWARLSRSRSYGSDQPVCVRPALGSKR